LPEHDGCALPDRGAAVTILLQLKMSIPNFHRWALLGMLASVATLAVVLFAVSFGSSGDDDDVDQRFYGYFLRDAKATEDMGLPVYWLGRGFTAGALTFQGPYGAEFGGEVQGGGIFMGYISWLDGTPGEGTNIGLEITVYSPDAWELARERIINPPPPGVPSRYTVTRRTVEVMGREAELISAPSGRRRVNSLTLVLDLGSVVVVPEARSVLSADGASEFNIFIKNPDLFVQVIDENLRPYPE
jgi:hypothetical protein